ncbi:MAG: hypothetical protein R3217_10505 [Gammaproteobacteria bacterium]|nr:hypothetical protein [Gammaproteobacteria bacterium]
MGKQRAGRNPELRRLIANEAARLIAEEGIRDFLKAKRKAAMRYGVSEREGGFPTNQEIEQQVFEYQRLFQADSQPAELRRLREAACQAMKLFRDFQPRLVGQVLLGHATRHSDIQLHLFADSPEFVVMHLIDREIPFETIERRFRQTTGDHVTVPAYRFLAGEITVDAAVFPETGIRAAPASPVDGRPMKRASLADLENLLDEEHGGETTDEIGLPGLA